RRPTRSVARFPLAIACRSWAERLRHCVRVCRCGYTVSVDPVMVFGPSPILNVTVERRGGDEDDVHLHPGGQGFWIARMLAALDVPVTLCGCFGGETGTVVRGLIGQIGTDLRAVQVESENGASVFDQRSGAGQPSAALTEP